MSLNDVPSEQPGDAPSEQPVNTTLDAAHLILLQALAVRALDAEDAPYARVTISDAGPEMGMVAEVEYTAAPEHGKRPYWNYDKRQYWHPDRTTDKIDSIIWWIFDMAEDEAEARTLDLAEDV